ncbi:FRG domain-containing protein [Bifidobacterium avesanii]|nr:FRG domain-containing protein [Bifidobacterium avesanii]
MPDLKNYGERILLQQDVMIGSGEDGLVCHEVPLYAVEPLLQHYGSETRWLDLTESLPYALFFGLVRYGKPITVPQLNPGSESVAVGSGYAKARESCLSPIFQNIPVYIPDTVDFPQYSDYVYLYAISPGTPLPSLSDSDSSLRRKGLSRYSGGYVIDMREAVPSFYLRPHAQHGLLWLPSESVVSATGKDMVDGAQVCVFKIPAAAVLRWLSSAGMFAPSSIYPPLRHNARSSGREHITLSAESVARMSLNIEHVRDTKDPKQSKEPGTRILLEFDDETSTMERSFSDGQKLRDVDRGFLQWEKRLYRLQYEGRPHFGNAENKKALKRFGRLQNYITADTLFRDFLGDGTFGMEAK